MSECAGLCVHTVCQAVRRRCGRIVMVTYIDKKEKVELGACCRVAKSWRSMDGLLLHLHGFAECVCLIKGNEEVNSAL